jgi:hypothetical protein
MTGIKLVCVLAGLCLSCLEKPGQGWSVSYHVGIHASVSSNFPFCAVLMNSLRLYTTEGNVSLTQSAVARGKYATPAFGQLVCDVSCPTTSPCIASLSQYVAERLKLGTMQTPQEKYSIMRCRDNMILTIKHRRRNVIHRFSSSFYKLARNSKGALSEPTAPTCPTIGYHAPI